MKTQILIGLFFCHFLADYTHLSTAWMLNAKRLGKPLLPIFQHAVVHGVLMGLFLRVCLGGWGSYNDTVAYLFYFQIVTHFIIDVWKGKMNGWFPSLQSPTNKWHWIVFGLDQYLHALVIILMVSYL